MEAADKNSDKGTEKPDTNAPLDEIYRNVRHALSHNHELEPNHITSMVNTILRRKQFRMSNGELFISSLLKCCICKRNKYIKGTTV